MQENQKAKIVVVDDDHVDIRMFERGMKKAGLSNEIVIANDGQQALEILSGERGNEPLPLPYIVLLDLNMPRMNGFEFLQAVRSDERLRKTVVFVLSTSDRLEDREAAYDLNVAGYLVKGSPSENFEQQLGLIQKYLSSVSLYEDED